MNRLLGGVLATMAEFARSVPTFRLELGGEVAAGPRTLVRFLENWSAA